MAELSKEYFDKQLGRLVTKDDLAEQVSKLVTKDDLTKQVEKLVTIEILDEKFEEQAQLINRAFQEQKDHFDKRIDELEDKIEALTAKLTAHLELSDKRYLELKRRDTVIAKWLKQIADKTGVEIDLAELEKF